MPVLRIFCWTLIFIIRIRFPPGSSITSILKKRYNNNGSLAAFRKFQRVELKLVKAKLDLSFLNSCKKHSVIPRYLRFKVTNRHLHKTAAYRQCQKKLLHEEINQKLFRTRILSSQSTTAYSHLAFLVSALDLIHLKTLTDQENSRKLNRFQKMQDRKLFRLCSDSNGNRSLNADNIIFNFSRRLLTDDEKNILRKGLDFALPRQRHNRRYA